MLVALNDGVQPSSRVGGKSASLMRLHSTPGVSAHVPGGFALSVDFFEAWVDAVAGSDAWAGAQPKLASRAEGPELCRELKAMARGLPLNPEQAEALERLRAAIASWPRGLAAVRSSAPEEDGSAVSFAGVFETRLGVTAEGLEDAVRDCFASAFDHRVFSYAGARRPAFAAAVMEMVDSRRAGVAFSANPLNSDLDEMLVDGSWGLGESVVDGSVVADRFVWNKVEGRTVETVVGSKAVERRLVSGGGVALQPVDEQRQAERTMADDQLRALAALVTVVEKEHGAPVDIEWALTEAGELRLLQARPITTIHPLDANMITPPGARRVLYYDYNIVSDATTTSPFTRLDMAVYSDFTGIIIACMKQGGSEFKFPEDPGQLMFNGQSRQFVNMSHGFRFTGPKELAKHMDLLDPYLASVLRSSNCDARRYKSARLPPEVSCCAAIRFCRTLPIRKLWSLLKKWKRQPAETKAEYIKVVRQDLDTLEALERRGAGDAGLVAYYRELLHAICSSLEFEMAGMMTVLGLFKSLQKTRIEGKTEQERSEAEALCGGFVGDELMEINIAMYNLARKLPAELWSEYDDKLGALVARIADNVAGRASDLPRPFVDDWLAFMSKYGFDGSDQLFVSSPRYVDSPELLLRKLRFSVGDAIDDPSEVMRHRAARRREVMTLQRERECRGCFAQLRSRKLAKRDLQLEHIMWIRNSAKLHLTRVIAALRAELLRVQARLLAAGRLDEEGDIFHLTLEEIDGALSQPDRDLRATLAAHKAVYRRASAAKECPMLVDSRCRILRPDAAKGEPGTLVGAALSPGVASGVVRVCSSSMDRLEPGEILAAVVTDPAWTPMFAGASAVILQIGGALQHGALCAREYGKPAVSGIEVMTQLETGVRVTVDGNTGVVRIDDGANRSMSRRPQRRGMP